MNLFVEIDGTYYNKSQIVYFEKVDFTKLILYLSNGDRFEIKTKTPQKLGQLINELRNLE